MGIAHVGQVKRYWELGNNKYSSAVGIIEYYNKRLKLRNSEFSIFNIEEQEELGGIGKKLKISESFAIRQIIWIFF